MIIPALHFQNFKWSPSTFAFFQEETFDHRLIRFLIDGEGLLSNIGVITGVLLLVVLRFLLPPTRRISLRFPLLCLAAHVVLVLVHMFFEPRPAFARLENILEITAIFLLLTSLGRLGFLFFYEALFVSRFSQTTPKIIGDIFQGLVYVAVVLVTMKVSGVQLGSLLVTSALLTAVIGFALQETLGNLVAGITLQIQEPFDVGDWVQLDGHEPLGEVTEINWRATKMITLDRVEVTIPNGVLAKNSILNYTKPTNVARRNIYILVPYRIPPRKVHEAILKILPEIPEVLTDPAPSVVTYRFLESGMVEYWVRFFITAFHRRDIIDGNVRDRIWYALERADVDHPYGTSTIQLHRIDQESHSYFREVEIRTVQRHLNSIPFLDLLSEEDRHELAANVQKQIYAPTEIILRQGEPGEDFYIINSGLVSIQMDNQEIKQIQAGEYFGEISLLTGEPRVATVIAITQVEVYVMGHAAFREILKKHPTLAEEMSRVVVNRQLEIEQLRTRISEIEVAKQVTDRSQLMLDKIRQFFSL
ncbi:MAG: mechanosensitive ion channel [Acidobacteria bacterium]|nr:mechanosensitive ion channel [Acidobacteriota bacterium]